MPTFDGNDILREAVRSLNIHLAAIIAETSFWANPQVHESRLKCTGSAAWYPNIRRYKAGHEERGETTVDGTRLDDNTFANAMIKRALGFPHGQLTSFATCHIWPRTCYDARYHTVIANLVLIPRAIASLTDYDPDVQAALQYRSYELYGWHPAEEKPPVRPPFYPTNWRPPFPAPQRLLRYPGAPMPGIGGETVGSKNMVPDEGVSSGPCGQEDKIGVFVRTTLTRMLGNNEIHPNEIKRLLTKEYSKRTFGLPFPLLCKPPLELRRRYWRDIVKVRGEEYFICNHWYDYNRPEFLKWLQLKTWVQ